MIMAGGLVGYFWGMGRIDAQWKRWLVGISGIAIAAPQILSSIAGGAVAVIVIVLHMATRKRSDESYVEINEQLKEAT